MKRFRLSLAAVFFLLCLSAAALAGQTREIVDMAGRHLVVPVSPRKVYSTNPIGTTLIYTLAPDQLMGWNYELRPGEKRFLPAEYRDLPVIGGWFSTQTGNLEEIMALKPDLFVSMSFINETARSFADKLQDQTGIPVVLVDNELTRLDESYLFLGKLLREEERAEVLARYCRETVRSIADRAARIPQDKRVRVYYAEGPDGRKTDPAGSIHTQVLDLAGGVNVAEVPMGPQVGMSSVSMEQILLWNPDLIIAWGASRGGYSEGIAGDTHWKDIEAVKSGHIYAVPDNPFCWFDRPPSVNRVLGLRWLANLLYPEIFDFDIVEEARNFYRLFWHYDLGEEEAREILIRSMRKK